MYHVHGTHVVPGMTESQARQARRWEVPAMIVALLVIPYLLIDFYAPDGWETVTDVAYFLFWGFFVVEMLVMLRLAPDNWAWARRNLLDIAIIAVTAPVTFANEHVEAIQVLWLLRILDLMPVIHRHLFRVTVIRFAFILWALVIFGGGIAYAVLENNQETPPNLLEAIYWANTTVSTVGYGDWLPHTDETMLLAIPLQAMGVVLGAILVAGILPLFDKEFAEGFRDRVAQAVTKISGDVADIEADIEEISEGERAQDRVLAQIARDLAALKAHVGSAPAPDPEADTAGPGGEDARSV
ncbi:MAG: ion channel [Solirubrobacteraceae bacterium]|nr:ion channel [Solirubrobacteraceae bacterium]